ncbi:MAG TPA: hypothetical protein VE866_02645, partial [Candidatus Binatia bacterium]|nr:hypothetical protein [Candidatus Binatia bacterium]
MGDRVSPSKRTDLARAGRLKKALESGAPPTFVQPATSSLSANGACSASSCPVPDSFEPLNTPKSPQARLE